MSFNSMKPAIRAALIAFVLAALAFIITMQSPVTPWTISDPGTDSSVFRYVAYEMSSGGMPYADTFDHKGPLLYLINYLGMQIGYLKGVWVVELVMMCLSLALFYKAARLQCSRTRSLCVTLIAAAMLLKYFEGGNLTEEYALPFVAASILLFLDFLLNRKINYFKLVICGVCLGAVLMLRPNMAVVWVVMPVAMIVRLAKDGELKKLPTYAACFVLGVVVAIAPIVIWLLSNGALEACLTDYLGFNLQYVNSGLEGSLSAARVDSFIFFLNNPFILAALVASAYTTWSKREIPEIAITVLFLITIATASMSGRQYLHYGLLLVPVAIYPLAWLFGSVERPEPQFQMIFRITLSLYISLALSVPLLLSATDVASKSMLDPEKITLSEALDETVQCVKKNTNADDRITVYGNWDAVYVLSHRLSASEYSYQFPISQVNKSISEDYFAALDRELPKIVVVQVDYYDEKIESYIEKHHYELILEIQGNGSKTKGAGAKVFKLPN